MKTLAPWRAHVVSPWPDLEAMERRMRRMLGRSWPEPETTMDWAPAMDLSETDGELELTVELPGLKPQEVQLNVEDDVLTIRGEKRDEKKKENGKRHVWERSYGAFERGLTLPRGVDETQIKASFKDGVLKVTLPKPPEVKGRKIPIET